MDFYRKYLPLLHLDERQYNVIALTGGRMSGKTTHSILGVLIECLRKKSRVCFFRETKDTLDESLKAELSNIIAEYFPQRGIVVQKDKILFANGSYIFFKGLKDVNTSSIENLKGIATSTDIFMIDEAQAVSKAVWDVLIPTLRKEGCVLIVVYNRINNNLPVEDALFLDYESKTAPEGTYFVEVNYPELIPYGLISKTALERAELLKKYKPDDYRMIYLNQPPDISSRAVVKYFNNENICNINYLPDEDLILTMDFNVDPMMWCVCHKDDKNLYQFDEIVIDNCTTQDAINEFINRYPDHKGNIILCGDASGNYRKTQSNQSDYVICKNALMKHGYEKILQNTRPFNPPINQRVKAFNQLVYDDNGERHYFVSDNCKWTLYNLRNLLYKEGTSIIDLPTPARIQADNNLKYIGHIFDAISYPAEYYWSIKLDNNEKPKVIDPSQEWTMAEVLKRSTEKKKW